ncbi:hypothetical protein Acr_00g0058720 [Actinidia rufa]|uniref:Uncharacterized protein n=1 Tax=Actinidia rufa TaxID=165716 RepID=A0A7J0DPE3_9ERIC|nr:hypothetical protein Acr_00g0058720 [Actinidia rufa]
MLLCAKGAGSEGCVFGGSAMVLVRAPRAPRDLTDSGLELFLGTTSGIRAKFESPESHRSDFDSDRKSISNSDQIQSAQNWRLSIPPDSSRRDKTPTPNCIKIERWTRPHPPPEVRHHDEASAHGLWTKLKEIYREKTFQNKALMRRLVLKLQRGTIVAEQMSEFQRRDQKRGLKKEAIEVKKRGQKKRRDKKNCPRNKIQDQSSEVATTTMMAMDESDVLLAVLADEESDWISDSGNTYHLCRDRDVFSIHVACEGLVRMANNTTKSCWQRNSPVLHSRREIHEGDRGAQGDALRKVQKSDQTREGATSVGCPWKASEERDRVDGAGSEGCVFGGSAMVLVRAPRAPRDLTESGLELVGCESKTVSDGER